MYIHAGDTVHIIVRAASGLTGVFGNDLQSRLQGANLRVMLINDNAVPVSSGWSFGPLIVQVVPQIDFGDIYDIARLVEGAAGASGFYVDYGTAVPQLVATRFGQDSTPSSRQYEQLQNNPPPVINPPPGHVPTLTDFFGLNNLPKMPDDLGQKLLLGGVIALAVVFLFGRR